MHAIALLKTASASAMCPICFDLLTTPVGIACGHVLCRGCAERCLEQRPCCPLCNRRIPHKRGLIPLPGLCAFTQLARSALNRVWARCDIDLEVSDRERKRSRNGHEPRDQASDYEGHQEAQQSGAQCSPARDSTQWMREGSEVSDTQRLSLLETDVLHITAAPFVPLQTPDMEQHAVAACSVAVATPQLPRPAAGASIISGEPSHHLSPSTASTTTTIMDDVGESSVFGRVVCVIRTPTTNCYWQRCGISTREVEMTPVASRGGCCELCGLDLLDRSGMRKYLKMLLQTGQGCSAAELMTLTEDQLVGMLGCMWEIHCTPEHGQSAVGVVHHNCLAWCGVLDYYTVDDHSGAVQGAGSLVVEVPDGVPLETGGCIRGRVATLQYVAQRVLHKATAAFSSTGCVSDSEWSHLCDTALRCSVCNQPHLVGCRRCVAAERGLSTCGTAFHYLCALLTDADHCVVFGLDDDQLCAGEPAVRDSGAVDVWCGPCRVQFEAGQKG